MATKKQVEETVTDKNAVTLTKGGVTYTLSDPIMIVALKNQGYEEG